MPNYCQCFLRIYSDDSALAEIIEFVKDGEVSLSFDKIIPYPEPFRSLDDAAQKWEAEASRASDWSDRPRDGYNQGGFEWCRENWGTKWDTCSVSVITQSEWDIIYKFTTAWTPPLPVVDRIAEMYPANTFTLEYYERGMEFCGSVRWENGKRTKQTEGNYYGFMGG